MKRFCILSLMVLLVLSVALPVMAQDDFVTVHFWTAPNPNQEAYWSVIVDEWNADNPDIQIEWQPIPTGASSEEVLLNAIATGTAPDISTNIFTGFAAQMAESGAAVALEEEFDDFWDVVEGHNMRSILEGGWGLGGHYYVLPLYSNAMQYWWGLDLIEQAGFSAENPPRTYGDVAAIAEAVAVEGEVFAIGFPSPANWWDRWFGFRWCAVPGPRKWGSPVRQRIWLCRSRVHGRHVRQRLGRALGAGGRAADRSDCGQGYGTLVHWRNQGKLPRFPVCDHPAACAKRLPGG